MYCFKCGINLSEGDQFCWSCGAKQRPYHKPTVFQTNASDCEPTTLSSHKVWRCQQCGNWIDHDPCIVCNKENQIPVKPITMDDRIFGCPACGQLQIYRDYCHRCGQLFSVSPTPEKTTTESRPMAYYYFLKYVLLPGSIISLILGFVYLLLYFGISADVKEYTRLLKYLVGNSRLEAMAWNGVLYVYSGITGIFSWNLLTSHKQKFLLVYLFTRIGGLIFNMLIGFLVNNELYTTIGVIVGSIIVLVEMNYFQKRSDLFVN
ncbi:MAG: hypothetical protein IKT68_01455 [Clostridia bacterium]|nr:hypothetical protein [Clostridia bacterium]